mmetsp:Transcript_35610/g.79149  ORF Transcript_35610/g.79149 Transcript_35610/m.79149 type:complete len:244 (-) Transcript_35610:580-1311(-)
MAHGSSSEGAFLVFHAAAEQKFARACAVAGTQMLWVTTNRPPYIMPTPEAHAAKDRFLPPLLCSTPKMTPASRAPRQSGKLAGMMAPLNSSSSDTPVSAATSAISSQFRGSRICLLERLVAERNSGHTFMSCSRAPVTRTTVPIASPTFSQLSRPEGKRSSSASSLGSVPRVAGALACAYALRNIAMTVIQKLVPMQLVKIWPADTGGRSPEGSVAAATGDSSAPVTWTSGGGGRGRACCCGS